MITAYLQPTKLDLNFSPKIFIYIKYISVAIYKAMEQVQAGHRKVILACQVNRGQQVAAVGTSLCYTRL